MKEKCVTTALGPLETRQAEFVCLDKLPYPDEEVFALENLLSTEECQSLIIDTEGIGYGETGFPKEYRGNQRLKLLDQSLAESMWDRLRPHVPETIVEQGLVWKPVGLNTMWRISKYEKGDQFQAHNDSNYQQSKRCLSMYTVNIYLNDDFEGGATRFYLNRDDVIPLRMPRGSAVIFRQLPFREYLHDGARVESGYKYLMRTDVMYELQSSEEERLQVERIAADASFRGAGGLMNWGSN